MVLEISTRTATTKVRFNLIVLSLQNVQDEKDELYEVKSKLALYVLEFFFDRYVV